MTDQTKHTAAGRAFLKKRALQKSYRQRISSLELSKEAMQLRDLFFKIHKLQLKAFDCSFDEKSEVRESAQTLQLLMKKANEIAKEANLETSI